MVHAGDRYKVWRYRGEVLIALVLVLAVTPFADICIIVYIYIASDLKSGVLLAGLG